MKYLDDKAVAEEYDEHGVVMPDGEVTETTSRSTALMLAGFYGKGAKRRTVYVTEWEDAPEEENDG